MTVIGAFRKRMISGFKAVNVKEYKKSKFQQNNKVIILLSVFIIVEQILCAQFLCEKILYKKIFYINSLLMFMFFAGAIYLNSKNKFAAVKLNYFFEIAVSLAAVTVISLRSILIAQEIFYLPSVYIAVIYGAAIFLVLEYKQSFIVYFAGSVFLISLIVHYRPSSEYSRVFTDVAVNNFIAWLVSIIHYKKSINEFNHLKIIEDNYLSLNKRNERMNKINTKLRSKSITDELTKLYNRREIEKNLDYLFVKANSNIHYKFSVIMCDLDDFSKVNNSFGVSSYSFEDNRDDLISRADKRLYKAKESGKNKVVMR